MNKTLIKIIKRKDTEVMTTPDRGNVCQVKSIPTYGKEKNEPNLHRKIAQTVSTWISERRESNRNEAVSAIRKLFGDESLLRKTA